MLLLPIWLLMQIAFGFFLRSDKFLRANKWVEKVYEDFEKLSQSKAFKLLVGFHNTLIN